MAKLIEKPAMVMAAGGLMKYIASAILFVFIASLAATAQEAPPKEDLKQTVDYLLNYVAGSECVFIRNGQEHDAKKASSHMKRKYNHFRDEIKTPEDFIRLAGTMSTRSGKPYMVRFKSGKEMPCAEWLLEVLTEHRKVSRADSTR